MLAVKGCHRVLLVCLFAAFVLSCGLCASAASVLSDNEQAAVTGACAYADCNGSYTCPTTSCVFEARVNDWQQQTGSTVVFCKATDGTPTVCYNTKTYICATTYGGDMCMYLLAVWTRAGC